MSDQVYYEIVTKTSKDYVAGSTNSDVHILMIGNNASSTSEWHQLDNFFRDDFEIGREDRFSFLSKDVGLPEVIRFKIDKLSDSCGWLCDWVIVKHPTKGEVFFSVYDVVLEEIAVRTGEATLPQQDKIPLFRDLRKLETQRNRFTYRWHAIPAADEIGWDLPRFCAAETYDQLPLLFKANDVQKDDFDSNRQIAKYNLYAELLESKFTDITITNFDDYKSLFNFELIPSEMPPFYDRWRLDEEFGRQMLSGVNPTVIERCDKLLKQFQDAEEYIFGDKTSAAKLLKEKRLYIINYRGLLDGQVRNKNKQGQQLYCTDAICMLQVGNDKQLRPIAIQLEEDGHVFTPKDSEHDWLLAKMYFRNTDANIHEYKNHLMQTHIMIEPVGVAMFQTFSRNHPIYKLLRPHLQTVASINTLGRAFLIGPKAATNFTLSLNGLEATRDAFRRATFEDLIIPKIFKKHGTDDPEALPHYNYREDSLCLWAAIEKFVSNIVRHYYKNDQDVTEDVELIDFVECVAIEGIGWDGNGTKGFPTKLFTIPDVIEYCTMVIFTSSVQHAASNFGQFEIYKFIPNAPGGMRLPPHKKGEATLKRIFQSLPDAFMGCLQIGTAYTLSSFSPNEIFLGNYPMMLFTEEKPLLMIKEFQQELIKLSDAFKERNKSLIIPYIYLLPDRIPNSIAV